MNTIETQESFTNLEIYHILKNEIVSLKLTPGQYISEIDISKRFHVSRTPIREVFKRLEYDNLIKAIKNKGTIITPIDFKAISQFMYIREKLELGLLEDVISNIPVESIANLSLILVKQRKVIIDQSNSLITRSLAFFELDNEFHKTIFHIANKTSTWDMLMNMMPDYQRFRAVSAEFNSEDMLLELYAHHEIILKALEQGNFTDLKQVYKDHIYNGVSTFQKILKEKEDYFVN
ncbi:MAG: GntR family transcriptional regulator [Lachnospiraceae bacterium]